MRARIEPLESPSEAFTAGRAKFEFILCNEGQSPASGSLRLAAGPKDAATIEEKTISFDLAPGHELRESVSLEILASAQIFWLETEPLDHLTVPTRALLLHPDASTWKLPSSIASSSGRLIRHGGKTIADVKLAATEEGLQVETLYYQSKLSPNVEEPWKGTALELIAYHFPPEGPPLFDPPERRQICLVPEKNRVVARGLQGSRTTPAPDVQASCEAIENGWKISAVIPWQDFGFSSMPDRVPFDLVVDIPDPVAPVIRQLLLFNLPFAGSKRGYGYLETTA